MRQIRYKRRTFSVHFILSNFSQWKGVIGIKRCDAYLFELTRNRNCQIVLGMSWDGKYWKSCDIYGYIDRLYKFNLSLVKL